MPTQETTRIAKETTTVSKSDKASDKAGSTDADAAPKKSKKMKIIALAALVLIGGGAAAKFTILAPKPASAAEKADAAKKAAAKKPEPGPAIPLAETTVNLAGGHYLSISLSIETTKGTSDEFDTAEAADLVISEFSDRTMASLAGSKNRTAAKEDLLAKLKEAYPKKVQDLYYTKFVMQ